MSDKERDTSWILDIFKVVGAIAGSLSGAAVLFVVIGYTIVLSFIQEMNLYGLANFRASFLWRPTSGLSVMPAHFLATTLSLALAPSLFPSLYPYCPSFTARER